MDWPPVLAVASSLMSLVLGGFAIWLALYLFKEAKRTETEVAKSLAAISAESQALQKLTGRWMDRFTRHATQPRPADEGMLEHVVRAQTDPAPTEPLLAELVNCYVGLYFYAAQTRDIKALASRRSLYRASVRGPQAAAGAAAAGRRASGVRRQAGRPRVVKTCGKSLG